jgi:glycine/D-amino acid oxidase-like deaminating enzyme
MNRGYVYFRDVGNRVLLGGGRNLAVEAETTTQMVTTESIQQYLEELLDTVIVPDGTAVVEQRWAGVMAFTADHQPFVREVERGLWAAMTCNGMGVALASELAAQTVAVVLQNDSRT